MDRILDFGCGNGGFEEIVENKAIQSSWLVRNGCDGSIGIDANANKLHTASFVIGNGTEFIVADGRRLPFFDCSFDYIHESGVLHHVKDYELAICEIHRVLKVGGMLYLMETVDDNPFYAVARRISNSWENMKVESYFTSGIILDRLGNDFDIHNVGYYFRSILSDVFLSRFSNEPPFSLRGCKFVSDVLNKFGIGRRLCCHLVVECVKR